MRALIGYLPPLFFLLLRILLRERTLIWELFERTESTLVPVPLSSEMFFSENRKCILIMIPSLSDFFCWEHFWESKLWELFEKALRAPWERSHCGCALPLCSQMFFSQDAYFDTILPPPSVFFCCIMTELPLWSFFCIQVSWFFILGQPAASPA